MADLIKVRVLFFARSRELAGCHEAAVEVRSSCTARDVFDRIVNFYPGIEALRGEAILAIREEYRDFSDHLVLVAGDEITEQELKLDRIVDLVRSPSAGAVSTFIGTTRDNHDGKTVIRLEYEAYLSMAEKKLKQICGRISQRWQVTGIAIVHRIGSVPVGETSVIVAVSAPHRRDSMEAVHYGIDTLKAEVPIWKKEWYLDSAHPPEWKENCEGCTKLILKS